MPFIAFLGCDGSGKSSVIRQLTKQLLDQKQSVLLGHWRPAIFGEYSIKLGEISEDNPHGNSVRNPLSSILKLWWMGFNWWFEWLRILNKSSRDGYLVFDRFHADLLVDPVRYRYGANLKLAQLFSRLMPQPDIVIYLDASVEALLSRKTEVSAESLERAREGYLDLCSRHDNYFALNASGPIDEVVHKTSEIIKSHVDNCE